MPNAPLAARRSRSTSAILNARIVGRLSTSAASEKLDGFLQLLTEGLRLFLGGLQAAHEAGEVAVHDHSEVFISHVSSLLAALYAIVKVTLR